MSDIAIKVENLSKRYRIGLEEEIPETFVEAATNFITAPIRNFRQLRALARFEDGRRATGDGRRETGNSVPSHQSSVAPSDVIWALRDVSFEVERGEVVGIIGRNGAGKSTLLKILSRITHPTSGRVELKGRVSSLLEVGTGFHQELTGRENIYLNGTILGMTKAEVDRKFDEIVDFSGVEKFIDTPVKRYSSGMRVRLAFSVAAHLEPEILLVDEVLAVGDAEFQRKCLGKMGEISSQGRTVLFVSHNMDAIQRLCDRSILLENGYISLDDDSSRTVQKYLTAKSIDDSAAKSLDDFSRRKRHGELVKLKYCKILNSKGEVSSRLLFGEPFTICMNAFAKLELQRLSFFVGIDSYTEQRIVTVNSEDNGQVFSTAQNESVHICATIDSLILKPGAYLLTIGIRTGSRKKLDRLPHIMRLEILNATYTGIKPALAPSGLVHTIAHWERKFESST